MIPYVTINMFCVGKKNCSTALVSSTPCCLKHKSLTWKRLNDVSLFFFHILALLWTNLALAEMFYAFVPFQIVL